MYRFLLRPRWLLFHVVVVAAVAGMVWAGFWQLRRLDERQAFNATVEARATQSPVPLESLLAEITADPDALEWRPVVVTGSYLPDETVTVVNKSQGGIAGTFAVTPMVLDNGTLVLIERGFSSLSVADAAGIAPTPDGEVEVVGRLRPSQRRGTGGLSDRSDGALTEVQRIDIDRLAPQMPADVLPMYVELTASDPAEVDVLQPIAAPDLAEGPHLGYAVQWFIFSICVVVGWTLAVRRSIATRRAPR